eukprot:GFUD01020621.1.p1 GENE.GFUD01020621.1~~GFUD01020621.1.p1  ORF type:complete len:141 (-),score=64.42 GFUD01020621.1:144-566(-)
MANKAWAADATQPKYGTEKGVGGFSSLYKENRKKVVQSAENFRCQKCLELGHWTYECEGQRKYVARTTRTVIMKRKLGEAAGGGAKQEKVKKTESSSDSSDSSSSSSSSGSSSSDSSESEGDEATKQKVKKKKKKSKQKK